LKQPTRRKIPTPDSRGQGDECNGGRKLLTRLQLVVQSAGIPSISNKRVGETCSMTHHFQSLRIHAISADNLSIVEWNFRNQRHS